MKAPPQTPTAPAVTGKSGEIVIPPTRIFPEGVRLMLNPPLPVAGAPRNRSEVPPRKVEYRSPLPEGLSSTTNAIPRLLAQSPQVPWYAFLVGKSDAKVAPVAYASPLLSAVTDPSPPS